MSETAKVLLIPSLFCEECLVQLIPRVAESEGYRVVLALHPISDKCSQSQNDICATAGDVFTRIVPFSVVPCPPERQMEKLKARQVDDFLSKILGGVKS